MTVTFSNLNLIQNPLTTYWTNYYFGIANAFYQPQLLGTDSNSNVYFSTTTGGYISKVNNTGNTILWQNQFQVPYAYTNYFSASPSGNYIAYSSPVTVTGTNPNQLATYGLALLNSSGSVVFSLTSPSIALSTSSQHAITPKVTCDDNGNLYALWTNGLYKYNSSGTLQWSYQFSTNNTYYNTGVSSSLGDMFDIAVDPSGNVYIVVGNPNIPYVSGSIPICISKFSSTGTLLVSKAISKYTGSPYETNSSYWYQSIVKLNYDSVANVLFIQSIAYYSSFQNYYQVVISTDTNLSSFTISRLSQGLLTGYFFYPDGTGGGYIPFTSAAITLPQYTSGLQIAHLNSTLINPTYYQMTAFQTNSYAAGACCSAPGFSPTRIISGKAANTLYLNYYTDAYNNGTTTAFVSLASTSGPPAANTYAYYYANSAPVTTKQNGTTTANVVFKVSETANSTYIPTPVIISNATIATANTSTSSTTVSFSANTLVVNSSPAYSYFSTVTGIA